MTEPRELTRPDFLNAMIRIFNSDAEAIRQIKDHDMILRQRLDRALNYINHPICLVCGALEPCELKNDPNAPCTFDPTPRQLYDENKRLRQRLEQAEQERDNLRLRIQAVDAEHAEMERQKHTSIAAFQALERKFATAERERDEAIEAHRLACNQANVLAVTNERLVARVHELEERIRIANESTTY